MILQENEFFSIEFFDERGLEKVSNLTGLDYDNLEFEQEQENHFIAQAPNKRYFLFCNTDFTEKEITFNDFINRCRG